MTSFGRFFDTMGKSALQRRPCATLKLPHASEQTFAKEILVRVLACRTEASANHAICGNSHGPGIQCSGCPAEHAISPAMYDPTLHIDGLVVCSLLRNAKMTAPLCHLAQVQCRGKWLKDLPAVISGCNIASALFTNYCVLCTFVIHQERFNLGAQGSCPGPPTAQSRVELGS